jgi:hypothetical protein
MNTQSTLEQLRELKLYGMASRYQAVLEQPLHQQPEPHLLLGMLADADRPDGPLSQAIQTALSRLARTDQLFGGKGHNLRSAAAAL